MLESTTKIGDGELGGHSRALSSGSEESSDDDEEDDDSSLPAELVEGKSDAETWFNARNMCVKVLVAMCHGITNNEGSPLIDIDASPWKTISRMKIRPNSDHYIAEFDHRWKHLKRLRELTKKESSRAPRPRGWKLTKLHDWLCLHPIVASADNNFLAKVVFIWKNAYEKAAAEAEQDDAKLGAGNWVGKYPFLRVLHAVIDNDASRVPSSAVQSFPLDVWLSRTTCF